MRVLQALLASPSLAVAAFPKNISNLIINRYEPGQYYDWHVDRALMGTSPNSTRRDLSFTLFLSQPAEYEGGELIIDADGGHRQVKLDAGQLFLYPAHYLHRVTEVTSGARICCVGWIESWVPDPMFRDTLWRMRQYMNEVRKSSTPAQISAVSEVYERLVRLASR
jgi:PKHD-type hydroxylase